MGLFVSWRIRRKSICEAPSSNLPVIRSHDARRVLKVGCLLVMDIFLINNCNSHRADTVARGTRDLKFLDTSRHSTADTGDRYTIARETVL